MAEFDPIKPVGPVWPRRPVEKTRRDEGQAKRPTVPERRPRRKDEDDESHIDEYV